MKHSTSFLRKLCIYTMAFLMSNIQQVALANSAGSMIPTITVVEELTRAQAEAKISDFLSRSDVREQLIKNGLSADEVSHRVASLSKTELNQMAAQIDQARAGGDILMTILIVVLIIYIVQRI